MGPVAETDHSAGQAEGIPYLGRQAAPAREHARGARRPALGGHALAATLGVLPAALLAGVAGSSAWFDGFYHPRAWSLVGLLAVVALATLAGLRSLRLTGPALTAAAGLAALAVWAGASMAWAESADRAWVEANRLGIYLVAFALAAAAVRGPRQGRLVLGAIAAGSVVVAVWIEVRLLSGSGPALFSGFRLDEPLRYANGLAGVLLAGLWPLLAVAESRARASVRAAAMALATLLCQLLVLTQSRSAFVALGASVLLLLTCVPGRSRRCLTLGLLAAGTAAALPALLAVFAGFEPDSAALPDATAVHRAGWTALFCAAATGVTGWLVVRSRPRVPRLPRAIAVLLVAAVIAAAAGGTAMLNPVPRVAERWRVFSSLEYDRSSGPRFTSAGGYRYDFWRIGLRQLAHQPLTGVGAGNYASTYFLERRQQDNVRQPHSLAVQTLAELGLVGGAALLLFVAALLHGGIARTAGTLAAGDRGILVAGLGTFAVWLAQSGVDWQHLVVGPSVAALMAAGVLVARPAAGQGPVAGRAGSRLPLLVLALVLAPLAGSLALRHSAENELRSGEAALSSSPAAALESARRVRRLNPQAVEALQLESAAHAALNRYPEARAALLRAARLEPSNHVPWALLGDLAARAGRWSVARESYGRAARLNPLDTDLAALARDPRQTLPR